jgi:hypothetical protein
MVSGEAPLLVVAAYVKRSPNTCWHRRHIGYDNIASITSVLVDVGYVIVVALGRSKKYLNEDCRVRDI